MGTLSVSGTVHRRYALSDNISRLDIVNKVLSIFGFVLILFSLYIIALTPGAQGYEISLYDEYPTYFWYLIIFCIFAFQIIIFLNIFTEMSSSISWKASYIGIVILFSILLLIPLIRRYALMGSGDPASHLGYMLDILQTGHIGSNTYPIAHLLGIITYWICGFDLNVSMLLYPCIFFVFYALVSYLLVDNILDTRTSMLIGMILVPLAIGGSHFTPQAQSNCYMPFVLYLYFSRFSEKNAFIYGMLMVVSSVLITFYHPLTSLFLIFSFVIFELSYSIFKYFKFDLYLAIRRSPQIIIIMTIIFWMWQSYARIIFGTFKKVNMWLYQDATESSSMFETYIEQISLVQPDLIYLLSSFVYVYGKGLILVFMGLVSIIVVFKAWNDKGIYINIYYLMFSIIFVICVVFGYGSLFIVTGTGYGRVMYYALFMSFFLIPAAVGYLLKMPDRPTLRVKLSLILFIMLLFCLAYLTPLTLYHSPIIKSVGQHVTDSQLIGIDTFFEIRNEQIQIIDVGISVDRIKDALYGRSKKMENVVYRTTFKVPYHFGYTNDTYFGNTFREPTYFTVGALFRISYQALIPEYPERWNFNQTDFFMLENDMSVSKVYSNREFDVYLLNPTLNSN